MSPYKKMDMSFQRKCKHDIGFRLVSTGQITNGSLRWRWYCNHGCGYDLNFDPFKFPNCVAIVEKEEGKLHPKLKPSRY